MAIYGSTAGTNALVQSWDGATNPTAAQVTAWLEEATAKIDRAIAMAGYVIPIPITLATLYPELTGLANLYAAAYILRAKGIDTLSGETEERSETWLKDFYAQLADLTLSNLLLLGLTLSPASTTGRRRRIGTLQMRKVDGYSAGTTDQWTIVQGEYSGLTLPTE